MIEPEKRKAIFLLHQEGMAVREISGRLSLGRNTVRRIIAQEGRAPARAFAPDIDPELLRRLHAECNGYVQRVWEKLQEEHGLKIKYSTLTRWLRLLGISLPPASRCDRVPDEPGAEMQHDTSPFTIALGSTPTKLQASLLYLRYSKRRYLQFYRVFDRFQMKCFLHRALLHWGYAPPVCIIDNTNLARLRGLGAQAVIVPEMEAFAKGYGFRFICHARGHSDRKAGEERSFFTVETNFLPGRAFSSLEDLNHQALEWSTVRLEQRPQGKPGLIPAKAFEYERGFLQQLPPHLPAPYKLLERSVDEYGYVALEANYYWVPGTGRGEVRVLRYDQHLEIYQSGQRLVQYPLPAEGVRNQPFHPPGQPPSRYQPRHRHQPSDQEEKRLRAMASAVSAYVDFILASPGLLHHQHLRRLLALSQRMSPELFVRSVERAHRYRITSLATLEQIARLQFQAGVDALPAPPIDESFRDRPAYQEGSLTDLPDLSQYE
jgi:transposase